LITFVLHLYVINKSLKLFYVFFLVINSLTFVLLKTSYLFESCSTKVLTKVNFTTRINSNEASRAGA